LTRNVEMNFNASALNTATRMREFLDTFFEQHGDDAIAVLVMHSWSFSHLDANGMFGSPEQSALDRFDEFLANCASDVRLITTKDVFDLQRSNQLSLSRIVDYEAFDVNIL